jgi:hypothetical protein
LRKVKTIFGLLILLVYTFDRCWSQCRHLDDVVNIKLSVSDTISPTTATVVRLDDEGIQINAIKSFGKPAFGNAHFSYAISRDRGLTWKWVDHVIPFQFLIKDAMIVEAPSDPTFRYKREGFSYYRSKDGGKAWYALKMGFPPQWTSLPDEGSAVGRPIHDLTLEAIHPNDPMTIFGSFRVIRGKNQKWLPGVFVSHDGGDSWREFTTVLASGNMLGISPTEPLFMLGLGQNGIWKSEDGGGHWLRISSLTMPHLKPNSEVGSKTTGEEAFLPEIHQVAFDEHNPRLIYLVSNLGLFRSTDRGGSWCLVNINADILDGVESIALNQSRAHEIVVGTSLGVFRSEDNGDSFVRIYPSGRDRKHP